MKWPSGFTASGTSCGIKADGSPDLGLLAADAPVVWAGTFTRNGAAAAPVRWSRSLRGGLARAVVVNSGNANACTGVAGDDAVQETSRSVAAALGCEAQEVLIASTGPIGVQLPVHRLLASVDRLAASLAPDVDAFATAILTTDTGSKTAVVDHGGAAFVGVAKGAAMCAPNMATMLAFIATDAEVDGGELQRSLELAVARSFNRISIDGCESTNDSVFLLASGRGPRLSGAELDESVGSVCVSLAEQIARDAEGASRLMRIEVAGAPTEEMAAALGRAVADSVLWRCAVNGADPNWGRVLSALGTVDRDLDLSRVTLSIGDRTVYESGEPVAGLVEAAAAMAADEFTVTCSVGSGPGQAEILSADTSAEYVLLNAEGSS